MNKSCRVLTTHERAELSPSRHNRRPDWQIDWLPVLDIDWLPVLHIDWLPVLHIDWLPVLDIGKTSTEPVLFIGSLQNHAKSCEIIWVKFPIRSARPFHQDSWSKGILNTGTFAIIYLASSVKWRHNSASLRD